MMNKPIVLSTGEWLLPVAVWQSPADFDDPRFTHNLGSEVGSNVFRSTDAGATFSLLGQAHIPQASADEHMIVERNDASLWMLVRTRYGIGESISTDRGETWSPGAPSAIQHIPTARFFIRRLSSGKLLRVTHDPPDGKTRSHLTAYLSYDDGTSWYGGLVVDERSQVSYPDAVQSPDGTIYLVYDRNRRSDREILMAAFTEEDVARGRFSSASRQRVLVNRAGGKPARQQPTDGD